MALKLKYDMVVAELDQLKNQVTEDVHEINEDKQELKMIIDDLSKDLHFNKAVLYKYVSSEIIGKLRQNT